MRTIKFRGKRVNRREWVYSTESFVQTDEGICMGLYNEEKDVIPDTVGQFVGLYDKDGKEIYEGDILTVKGIPFGVVRWHKDGYFFIDDSTGEVILDDTYRSIGEMIRFFNRNETAYSVIGNIHDNPELLKGCKQ